MPLVDPARELAATLEKITEGPSVAVDSRIAQLAHVEPWSAEFFRVLFELINRFDFVEREIQAIELDEDIREEALNSLGSMRKVFSNKNIMRHETNAIKPVLSASNLTIIRMLSRQIRDNVSYNAFSDQEKDEIIEDVSTLIDWLVGLQSEEKDFVRDALISGLKEFQFRMVRLEWFGSGYALQGIKDVIQAYLALEGARHFSDDGAELTDAILKKSKSFIKKVVSFTHLAKETSEGAEWLLKVYGAVSAISDGTKGISGFLTG